MATMNVVQARLVLRNGLAEEWAEKNPVLFRGELAAEINTGLLKIGDGTSAFSDLPYINVTQTFLEQELNKKVDKTGGIITGILTLNYTPVAATDAVNKRYVDEAISSAGLLKRAIVEQLPSITKADTNTIYMIKDAMSTGPDSYREFMVINGTWEQIGDTSVDLTNYIQKPATFVTGNFASFSANGALIDSGFSPNDLHINIATSNLIGGVLSSIDDNSISVDSLTGKMTLNRVSVNNLYVPDEDEFILVGGGA